jgi:hypothetical protein
VNPSFLGKVQEKLFEDLNENQKLAITKLMEDDWERTKVIGPGRGNLSYAKMRHEME